MHLVCLDLEGVLVPEIWLAVAQATGIKELARTTRDEPDYDVLMRFRLDILKRNDIRIADIQKIIQTLKPLRGARTFIQWLHSQTRVIILSDTFVEFAAPLMKQLGFPTLFCHSLVIDASGHITNYRLRQSDQKYKAVQAFQSLNFKVIAAGDSYNDLTMLQAADHGILFRPPASLVKAYPQLPVTRRHNELRIAIEKILNA